MGSTAADLGYRVVVTVGSDPAYLQVTVDLELRTHWALTVDEYAASRFSTADRAERRAQAASRRFPGARISVEPITA